MAIMCGVGAVPWTVYSSAERTHESVLSLEPSLLFVLCSVVSATMGALSRLYAGIPVNPVLIPCQVAFLLMITVNTTGYQYSGACYNGFALGAYVAMASTKKLLTSVCAFGGAGMLAGLWGLALSPYFVGFGGKGGFTAFLGYTTYWLINAFIRGFGSLLLRICGVNESDTIGGEDGKVDGSSGPGLQ
mmetsp:Transcript_6569/g.11661  ORF Transcript_6569/g.11661 Transcript_6569/m.11661 type:complete len:188 (-) Transcript_6569:152-715(-)